MRMLVKRVCMVAVLMISLKGFSQQLIQATLKLNANPDEVEVWLRPNFSNSTQYLAQIAVPIAWPSAAPAVQPADITVTLDPTFVTNFGSNYSVTPYPLAHNTCNTENYRVITLVRSGTGASNPQNWSAGQEFKLLTVKFPVGSPNGKVKIADYSLNGGSDGQGYFYTADGNANYYISSTSANNFYTSGQSTIGPTGCDGSGYVETNVTIPLACAIPSISINNITTTGADISWVAISGSSGYEYSITSSSTSPGSGTATTSTTFSPSALTAATQYYVHVRTNCGGGSFSNWASTNFSTASAPCIAPSTPTVNNVQITTADISWNAVSGAIGYEYILSTSSTTPASASGTGTATTATTYNASGLIGGTQYYIYVRTNCGSGNYSPWTSNNFTTQPPSCIPPSTPVVSSITTTTATIAWNAVSGSSGYEYVLSTSSVMPSGSGTAIFGTSINPSGLTPGTAYYIFVRNNCGGALYSNWVPASFNTMCPTPGPLNANGITSSSATITWNAIGAVNYQYDISTSSTPTTATPSSGGTATTGTSYNATGLSSGITYYAHVRAICSAGNFSNWSTVQFATVCTVPGPIVVGNINPTTANISWGAVPDVEGYEFIIATNPAIPTGSGTSTIFTNTSSSNLTQGTQYYVFVRTKCSPGVYSDWISQTFTTTYPPCNIPNSLTVSNISTSADINWSLISGAQGYEWGLTTSSTPPSSGTFNSSNSYHIENLASNTQYYVHVRTVCLGGRYSGWVSQPFKTACFSPSPFIARNEPHAGSVDLGWNKIKGAISYEYAILKYAAPPATSSNSITDTILHITKLEPGAKYFLHVRTHCTSGSVSEWSSLGFNTSGISMIANSVYDPIIRLSLYGIESPKENIFLFDVLGKKLKEISISGSITLINMAQYSPGVYYICYGKQRRYIAKFIKL